MSKWIRNRKRTNGCPDKLVGKKVELKDRSGGISISDANNFNECWNTSDGYPEDIVAYRIIDDEPTIAEKTPYQQLCEKHGVTEDVEWEIIENTGCESYYNIGEIVTLKRDGGDDDPLFNFGDDFWAVDVSWLRPYKDPSKIAPKLWAAYKDVLNDEALAALRDVICGDDHAAFCYDSESLMESITWQASKQCDGFWANVYTEKYNKPTTAIEMQDAEIGIPEPVNEVIGASVAGHIHRGADESGVTGSTTTDWYRNGFIPPFKRVDHKKPSASSFLEAANKTISQRGNDYDNPEGERSAESVATAFNAITKRDLTEAEIWLVLQLVKDVRQWQNPERFHYDSALDCVAYAALKAEALAK